MIIHTADLAKYNICPMMYKFGTSLPKDPFLLALKQALIYLYAFEMSNEKKADQQSMMNRWDRIWLKHAKTANLEDEEISEKAVDGWLIIKKYMDDVYLNDDRLAHIAGLNYRAKFFDDYIDTTYDIILSDEHGFLTLIEFSMETNHQNLQEQLDKDIAARTKLLLLHYAMPDTKCQLVRYNLNKILTKTFICGNKDFYTSTKRKIKRILNNIKNNTYRPNPHCKCVHPEKCKNGSKK